MREDLQGPGLLCIETSKIKENNVSNEELKEKKIILQNSYKLKLENDEYILEMKINDNNEIIFTSNKKNDLSLDYFESTYNLDLITEKTKLNGQPSIKEIFHLYDGKLFKNNKINLTMSEDKKYMYLNFINIVNLENINCIIELKKTKKANDDIL